jgi:hypothetical protein
MKLQNMVLVFVVPLDMRSQIMVELPTLLHINVSWTAEVRDINSVTCRVVPVTKLTGSSSDDCIY